MTVQQTTSRSPTYIADGVETTFPTNFEFLEAADVDVYVNGTMEVGTYTVTGGNNAEGDVIFNDPPANGAEIDILRDTARTQLTYEAAIATPRSLENTLDRLSRINQSQDRRIDRSLRTPEYENGDMIIPKSDERADKLLGFDVNGEPIAVITGRAQVNQPTLFTISSGVYDYLLAYEVFESTDLWVHITGLEVFTKDFTVTSNIAPNRTLTFDPSLDLSRADGEFCEVRYVGNALLTGQVADGAIDSPDKFSNRPVDLAAMSTGTPYFVLGYDAGGVPIYREPWLIGEKKDLTGTTIPPGWMEADGRAISRTKYFKLFAEYGELHGPGDGITTFNIPNFSGRTAVGRGQGYTKEGGQLGTFRSLGSTFGSEDITIQTDQVGRHQHLMYVDQNAVTSLSDPTEPVAVRRDNGGSDVYNHIMTRGTGSGGNVQDLGVTSYVWNETQQDIRTSTIPLDIQSPGLAVRCVIYTGVYD